MVLGLLNKKGYPMLILAKNTFPSLKKLEGAFLTDKKELKVVEIRRALLIGFFLMAL